MSYSIGEFARLCGNNAATLRAWQRRYGLLKPQRTDGGHRLYSDDDIRQALSILDWVRKGVPISQVKPLLSRPVIRLGDNWITIQETMLQHLHEGRIDALRQLIYDCGREYPRAELVTHLLRPLRSKVSAHLPAVMTLREILDGIIIAYTSFCLEGDRKAPGNNAFISGWHLSDHCEIWLEALTRTGQELRLNVLPSPPAILAPELFAQRKWFLVTTGKLTTGQKKQLAQWRNVVASLEVITL
ncbi:MerR family transcriptional regulator [Salmonella enterica subsp. enterica serovar Miami]|nr:MerR family transcriptional regulator [Salmonella enterica]EBU8672802.1 helix-turn-helix-type transcriptional regulator [Salmonella enterica subsp. enterica serovar Panama]ECF2800199.1 MerR family transcriptional regulator [Salmonella enterica subsp. enterica serovar Miami]EKO1093163.1 MerR family transcriptional regulator [Salmonella enterica subsp. enterica]EDO3655972.1 MerR family transcriptional regulator [Salmonella enterica]